MHNDNDKSQEKQPANQTQKEDKLFNKIKRMKDSVVENMDYNVPKDTLAGMVKAKTLSSSKTEDFFKEKGFSYKVAPKEEGSSDGYTISNQTSEKVYTKNDFSSNEGRKIAFMGVIRFLYYMGIGQDVTFAGQQNIHVGKDLNYTRNNNGRKYIPADKIDSNSAEEKQVLELTQQMGDLLYLKDLKADNNGIIRKDNTPPANKIIDFFLPTIEALLQINSNPNMPFPVFKRTKLNAEGKFLTKEERKGNTERASVSKTLETGMKEGIREYMANKENNISEEEIERLWNLEIPHEALYPSPKTYSFVENMNFLLDSPNVDPKLKELLGKIDVTYLNETISSKGTLSRVEKLIKMLRETALQSIVETIIEYKLNNIHSQETAFAIEKIQQMLKDPEKQITLDRGDKYSADSPIGKLIQESLNSSVTDEIMKDLIYFKMYQKIVLEPNILLREEKAVEMIFSDHEQKAQLNESGKKEENSFSRASISLNKMNTERKHSAALTDNNLEDNNSVKENSIKSPASPLSHFNTKSSPSIIS